MPKIVLKLIVLVLEGVKCLMVSRPEELPLRPLAERCGSLSTHTAPIRQTLLSEWFCHLFYLLLIAQLNIKF
jgi:hypothetical protein